LLFLAADLLVDGVFGAVLDFGLLIVYLSVVALAGGLLES
jgi:hypothetical protein